MWSLFSNVYAKNEGKIKEYENRGNVGSQGTMMLDGVKIGTAQFCNVKKNQTCDYNKYYKEDKWTTVDLKLSFNNSLSYRRHSINVKGKWRDWCDSKKVADKVWDISNQIDGFYYPDPNDFTAKRIVNDLKFEWHYGTTVGLHESMRQGKWVLYKKLKGSSNFEKIGEVKVGNSLVLTIKCRDFVCGATYYVTFNPSALSNTPIINGLTATLTHEHVINSNNTCDICKHFLFTYATSDGKPVPLANNLDFGAKMLSHTADGKGNCLIDFDYNITRIPDNAFSGTKINGRLVIPSTVKYIGARAFANTACNEISLSVGLEEIGDGAFEKCYNINKLPLPRTLKKIGSRAFMGCLSSGTLKIPGVAYIVRRDGEEKTLTFSPDRSVEIRMKMQPAEVGNLKFSGTYQAKEVTDGYILAQDRFWNVAKLKAAAPETQAVMVGPFRSWLEGTTANTSPSLSMRIDDSTTGIDNVAPLEMLNANDAEYYDLNGKRLDAPMKGVNIVKRGNKTMKVIIK